MVSFLTAKMAARTSSVNQQYIIIINIFFPDFVYAGGWFRVDADSSKQ